MCDATKMDKHNITYDHMNKHTYAGQYDARNQDRLLPEWIQELKHYFEKQLWHKYSSDHH
jgi:hypothetical protein